MGTLRPTGVESAAGDVIERGQRLAAFLDVLDRSRTPGALTLQIPADLPELAGYRDVRARLPGGGHAGGVEPGKLREDLARRAAAMLSDSAVAYSQVLADYSRAGDVEATRDMEDWVATVRAAVTIEALEAARVEPGSRVCSARVGLTLALRSLPHHGPARLLVAELARHLGRAATALGYTQAGYLPDPAWTRHESACRQNGVSISAFVVHQSMMVASATAAEARRAPQLADELEIVARRLERASAHVGMLVPGGFALRRLPPLF